MMKTKAMKTLLPYLLAAEMFNGLGNIGMSSRRYVKRNAFSSRAWRKRKNRIKMAKLSRRINRGR